MPVPFDRHSLVSWLVERHPRLKPLLDEHLEANDELLAHVLFGDITRHYLEICASGLVEEATALIVDLDAALACCDADVDNVIHVSFLENLDYDKRGLGWELLTPRLKAGFDLVHGHTSEY